MPRTTRPFLLSCACLGPLGLAACGDDAADEVMPIRIGLVLDLSEESVEFNTPLVQAAQMAEREINAAGGFFGGRPLEMIVSSDLGIPDRTLEAARHFIEEDGVVGMVGFDASFRAIDVAQLAKERRVPMISCCATADEFTTMQSGDDRFFFRTLPPDSLQIPVLAGLLEDSACERPAIFYRADTYGNPFGEGLEQALTDRGIEVAASVPYDPDAATLADEIAIVDAESPDCVTIIAFTPDARVLRRDWERLATTTDVRWFAADGLMGTTFGEDSPLFDGMRLSTPDQQPESERYEDYGQQFEIINGEPPGAFSAFQYDAVAVLALAIAAAGEDAEPADIRDKLFEVSQPGEGDRRVSPTRLHEGLRVLGDDRAVDYQGASGEIDFDACGDVRTDFAIFEYRSETDDFAKVQSMVAPANVNCPE